MRSSPRRRPPVRPRLVPLIAYFTLGSAARSSAPLFLWCILLHERRSTPPPRRAGACPRRCAALPTTTGVGAGIPDGPGWTADWARQGCRALRWGVPKGRRPPPTMGWGRQPSALPGIAPSADGALGRLGISRRAWRGCFAGCGQRVFRPLRRATGALPLDPAIFSRKN